MVILKNVLFASPMWREPLQEGEEPAYPGGLITQICHHWIQASHEQAQFEGYNSLRLPDAFSKEQFFDALNTHDPILFYGCGHGDEATFTGYMMEELLYACLNDEKMKDRITHLLSCLTANLLGPSIVNKGGLAYEGYKVEFSLYEIFYSEEFPPYPIDGTEYRLNWIWMEPEVLLTNAVLNGKSVEEAYNIAMSRYQAWIDYWSSCDPEKEPIAAEIISSLLEDFENLSVLGNKGIKIIPPSPSGKHRVFVYAFGCTGIQVKRDVGTNVVRVGIGCTTDNCSFLGVRFEIYDDKGVKVGEGTIDHSDRGVNWGEATFKCPTEDGDYTYTIRAFLDDTHGGVVEGKLRFIVGAGPTPPVGPQTVNISCNISYADIVLDGQHMRIYGGYDNEVSLYPGTHRIEVVGWEPADKQYVGAVINAQGGVDPPWNPSNPFEFYVPIEDIPGEEVRHLNIYLVFESAEPRTDIVFDTFIYNYGGRIEKSFGKLYIDGHGYGDPAEETDDSPPRTFNVGLGHSFILNVVMNNAGYDPQCPIPPHGHTMHGWFWTFLHREEGKKIDRGIFGPIGTEFTSRPVNHIDAIWLAMSGGRHGELSNAYYKLRFYPRFAGTPEYEMIKERFGKDYEQFGGWPEPLSGLLGPSWWSIYEGDYEIHIVTNEQRYKFLFWADLDPSHPQRKANPRIYTEFKHYEGCPPEEFYPEIPEDSTISNLGYLYPVFESYVCHVGIKQEGESVVFLDATPKDLDGKPERPFYRPTLLTYAKGQEFKITTDTPERITGVKIERYRLKIDELRNVKVGPGEYFDYWDVKEELYDTLPESIKADDDVIIITVYCGPEVTTRHLKIEVYPEGSGTTVPYPPGDHNIPVDQEVEIWAKANEGYCFDYWELDGEVRTSPQIYFRMDQDHVLRAYFKKVPAEELVTVNIRVAKGYGATEPEEGTYYYAVGTPKLRIYAKEIGAKFIQWEYWFVTLEGVEEPHKTEPFIGIDLDLSRPGTWYVEAYFEEIPTCKLTISSTAGGTTDPPPGSYVFPKDQKVTVTAIPDEGYEFSTWMLDGVASTENPIDVVMIRDYELTAYFQEISPPPATCRLSIRVLPDETWGTTVPYAPGEYDVDFGTTITLTAKPKEGYGIDHWEIDGVDKGSSPSITFVMDKDHEVLLYLKEVPSALQAKVMIEVQGGGSTDPPAGTYYFDVGSTLEVNAIPTRDWKFKHWEVWFVTPEGIEEEHSFITDRKLEIVLDRAGTYHVKAVFEKGPLWPLLLLLTVPFLPFLITALRKK